MINSNFNQDTGNDAFDIGIEVEEECNYEDEQGAHQIFNSGNLDNVHREAISCVQSKRKKSNSWTYAVLKSLGQLDGPSETKAQPLMPSYESAAPPNGKKISVSNNTARLTVNVFSL